MIRKCLAALVVCCTILCCADSFGVEPAYCGPMGNPEEPALRPVKWLWHGAKALVYHSHASFNEGRQKGFCPAVHGAATGVRRGTVRFGESVYRGAIGSRVPERGAYRAVGRWNEKLEAAVKLRKEESPATEPESEVVSPPPAAGILETPSGGEMEREPDAHFSWRGESAVERARRAYLGDRARVNEPRAGRGNLLRLAR